jgi:hypothetical protein
MGTIRPDFLMADIIKMVHPDLRDGQWRYLAPGQGEARPVDTSSH